ncbi:MAG: hypothetical protein U5K84_13245 [Alkalibacterium sp.]|nr:hypothetical protein [Alkalibacterium sp.]
MASLLRVETNHEHERYAKGPSSLKPEAPDKALKYYVEEFQKRVDPANGQISLSSGISNDQSIANELKKKKSSSRQIFQDTSISCRWVLLLEQHVEPLGALSLFFMGKEAV